ncbi:MAG: YvcK family protein, partial [Desulfobulbaceae bacterium]|nr:YvcK family protein [Desulfobulbaceae bacterium]
RSQEWDNIFSFFEPADREIKIREDVFDKASRFEVAFLVALGQSLLGNYAGEKAMLPVEINGGSLGKAYQLTLRQESERDCCLSGEELARYLALARMNRSLKSERVYTRLVAGQEGFTPPGLLFGLTYAWYLDNRFAPYIDYKMAIDRTEMSDLIPEQKKILSRRWEMVDFFRTVVFRQAPLSSLK